jgi:signal transduction histidine kinase
MSDSRNPVGQLQDSLSRMQNGLYIRMNDVTNRIQEAERINRELENNMDQEDQILKRENMFIHKVAQQMRSPLNVILGFTGLLEDSYKAIQAEQSEQDALMSQDEMNTITSMMKSNAIKLNRMVLMLYDSSEMGGGRKYERTDEVSCNALVQECIAYAKTHFDFSFSNMVPYDDDMFSVRVRLMYLY